MGFLEYIVIATIIITAVYVGMAAYEDSLNEVAEPHQFPIDNVYFKEANNTIQLSSTSWFKQLSEENLH